MKKSRYQISYYTPHGRDKAGSMLSVFFLVVFTVSAIGYLSLKNQIIALLG